MDKNEALNQQEEIDLLEIISNLWQHRKQIIFGTAVFSLIGILYAMLATPVYHSEALITPKESQKSGGAASLLTQFGGAGGLVASQFGIGNTSLNRIEIIVKGRELAENVINNNNLMPYLFPEMWDTSKKEWKVKDTAAIPKLRSGIELLRGKHLVVLVNSKNNTITLGINFPNATLAEKINNYYLVALNNKVREDVVRDAESNRVFLEASAKSTSDPLILEKIQNLAAVEIERMMLVNSQSFDILEKPVLPLSPVKPKRKLIIIISIFAGLFVSIASVYIYGLYIVIINKLKADNKYAN